MPCARHVLQLDPESGAGMALARAPLGWRPEAGVQGSFASAQRALLRPSPRRTSAQRARTLWPPPPAHCGVAWDRRTE
ncbi:hypothetical protein ARTHRO9V_210124 [Arthrobacter sp. 9V]|nr:hypothetical protein ARTHRO9V_210124 [Arthrobacter sp. 9V]